MNVAEAKELLDNHDFNACDTPDDVCEAVKAMLDYYEKSERNKKPYSEIRIRCEDSHKNVSYVVKRGRVITCSFASGMAAGLSYAGILKDEMVARFALQDAPNADAALNIMNRFGLSAYKYTLVP